MGRPDGAPDILWVGLSAMDYLGHEFGPDSLEVADTIVRLDRSIESFANDLAARFGDRVTITITADHGTQAIPEVAAARGRRAGRSPPGNPSGQDDGDLGGSAARSGAANFSGPFSESAPSATACSSRARRTISTGTACGPSHRPEKARRIATRSRDRRGRRVHRRGLTANVAPKRTPSGAARLSSARTARATSSPISTRFIYRHGDGDQTGEADQHVRVMWGMASALRLARRDHPARARTGRAAGRERRNPKVRCCRGFSETACGGPFRRWRDRNGPAQPSYAPTTPAGDQVIAGRLR
jgi:hypothetical protein